MRSLTFLLALCALIISASCSTPPSFCKCTCFTNSTIIELTPPKDSTTQQSFLYRRTDSSNPLDGLFSPGGAGKVRGGPKITRRSPSSPNPNPKLAHIPKHIPKLQTLTKRTPPSACTLCNRAFCLSQNLPICKNAEEKDIQTSCFQRDSRKDQGVVLGFICVTLGLLGWAAGRELVNRRRRSGHVEGTYAPLNR